MNVEIKLSIEWWLPTEGGNETVPEGYKDVLMEAAKERVFEMVKSGYQEGELNETAVLGLDGEPEDGLEFQGYWRSEETTSSD